MIKITVIGEPNEITATLRDSLTASEMAVLQISQEKPLSPFVPGPRRAEPLVMTVLVWVGGAVATGMTYDVIKQLSVKICGILEAKFGADKIKRDDEPTA